MRAVVLVLLTAALTEVAFRIVHGLRPVFIFPQATYNRFRPPPGTPIYGFPVNSRGFLDVEHPFAKPDGTLRVLGLGDSFAFGVVPYEDNYLTLLEDRLGESAGAEVINMGIPRTGVGDYLELLVDEGLALEPDAVLLTLYLGNDLRLSRRERAAPRSYLLAFLRYLVGIRPRLEGVVDGRDGGYRDDEPTFRTATYLNVLRRRLGGWRTEKPAYRRDFDAVARLLGRIDEVCAAARAPLLVALAPDELQVDPALRQRLFAAFPELDAADYDFERASRELAAELSRRGIEHVDLLPAFRAAIADGALYKPRDTHWNRRGNRLAAEEIYAALRRSG